MAEEDLDKTAFTCHVGPYRFLRISFGLMNAPAAFQPALDLFLSGFKSKLCLVHLDDVIVF